MAAGARRDLLKQDYIRNVEATFAQRWNDLTEAATREGPDAVDTIIRDVCVECVVPFYTAAVWKRPYLSDAEQAAILRRREARGAAQLPVITCFDGVSSTDSPTHAPLDFLRSPVLRSWPLSATGFHFSYIALLSYALVGVSALRAR